MKLTTATLALLAAIIFVPVAARASITTVPAGLNPGDQYRLVFVTPNAGNSQSGDIGTYNAKVTERANAVPELLALGTTWSMIGSTAAVSARENTLTDPALDGPGVPIFLLNGALFASNNVDLWITTNNFQPDLNITEQGNMYNGRVWTGDVENGLGNSQVLGGSSPLFGNSAPSLGSSIPVIPERGVPGQNGWMFDWTFETWQQAGYYAMSGVLAVPDNPGVVPEPVSMLTWCGLALTAYWGKTARRRRA